MSAALDRLYDLLPAFYRRRDAERGYPLQALLRVIAEQVNVVEADIDQLYDNWFIETCQDWVVPYLGELVGYQPVHDAGEPSDVITTEGQRRNKILIPRREVANTIRYRRRKGTLALLEDLAGAVAGWPARAVEFYKLLAFAQGINYLRPKRGRTVNLRDGTALDLLGSAFDESAHTVDVRRASSSRTPGRFNLPNVGLFVWRLKSYSVSHTQAHCLESVGPQWYAFSALGQDTPLFTMPRPTSASDHPPGELDLPLPIRRRAFQQKRKEPGPTPWQASAAYYGVDKSLAIWAPQWPRHNSPPLVDPKSIIPADLTNWQARPPKDYVAVDVALGRMVFPENQLPKKGVSVRYQYGFSADLGGGEYPRRIAAAADAKIYRVVEQDPNLHSIKQALHQWEKDKPPRAIIEIADSRVYDETIHIDLAPDQSLQLRAGNRCRPIVYLPERHLDRPNAMHVRVQSGSTFVLDGLLIAGHAVHIEGAGTDGKPPEIIIRDATLVPGWGLHGDCQPRHPAKPSLELFNTQATVRITSSILGAILVSQNEARTEPVPLFIADSVMDGTGLHRVVLSAPGALLAWTNVTIFRSTVFGCVHTHSLDLAENCIFASPVQVARGQRGCVRFCYVAPGSRTPRRYECQPDLVVQAAAAHADDEMLPPADKAAAQERERRRVRPQWSGTRYGSPDYCRLTDACADEIRRGADDEAEMGVFHDVYEAQRAANLRARVDEFTPAGMDVGIIHAS
jgi:hypothetical protein